MGRLYLMIAVFLAPSFNFHAANEIHDVSDKVSRWKLERNDEGIKIYTRWIELEDNLKVRQMKGEMECNHSAEHISTIIRDEEMALKWLTRVVEHKKLRKNGQDEWISYTLFSLPWPFDNQDLVAKNKIFREGGKIIIKVEGLPNHIPEKQGISRIQFFEGTWILTHISDEKTRIEYNVITKSKPVAPRWIADPIIKNNFWTMLNNLQSVLE